MTGSMPIGPRWTYAQVSALEDRLGERFELVEGHIFAMSGETERHHDLRMAVFLQLHGQLAGGPCKPFTEGLRVKVTSVDADYRYPDASVFCEARRHWQDDSLLFTNPAFLFEVTSDSTRDVDHGVKVREYLALQSVRAYVVVEHDTQRVTIYRRTTSGVTSTPVASGGLVLQDGLELDVDAIYRA